MTITIEETLELLGKGNITTSIVFGPCGNKGLQYSVLCMTSEGQEFEKPFGAHSIDHAVRIAHIECMKRGWLNGYWEERN